MLLEKRILTAAMLEGFAAHMTEEERSENTRQYYLRVLRELAVFAGTEPVTKQTVIDFKEQLTTSGYTAGTVNTYLSALGSFFDFAGWPELKVRHLKVQPKAYAAPEEQRSEAGKSGQKSQDYLLSASISFATWPRRLTPSTISST